MMMTLDWARVSGQDGTIMTPAPSPFSSVVSILERTPDETSLSPRGYPRLPNLHTSCAPVAKMRTEPSNEKGCMIARIDRLMRQQCATATPEISKRGVHGARMVALPRSLAMINTC
jgi:hypothetical protein